MIWLAEITFSLLASMSGCPARESFTWAPAWKPAPWRSVTCTAVASPEKRGRTEFTAGAPEPLSGAQPVSGVKAAVGAPPSVPRISARAK